MSFLRIALIYLCLAAPAAQAQGKPELDVYFFGNSLVNHLSEDEPHTNVPHWLNVMAQADGRRFAVDGQWGFVRNFADELPPRSNWSFPGVRGVWDARSSSFGRSGYDAIVLNPANFIQYQGADRPYDGDNPGNESPQSATLRVFDWVSRELPDVPFYIYEGWAEMAGVAGNFPPRKRGLRRYHAFNQSDYHDWYKDYVDGLNAARPERSVRLIPVASTLSALLSDDRLARIPVTDLYSDDAPHGRPTIYFLAAMVTYAALYETPPPSGLTLPDSIHPQVRDNYDWIAQQVWERAGPDAEEASIVVPTEPESERVETADAATTPVPKTEPALQTTDRVPVVDDTSRTTVATTPPPSPAPATVKTPAKLTLAPDGIPALSMGLNGIADWSTQHPFVNVMKTARPWIGHINGQWGGVDIAELRAGGHLNENGWPVSLPENVSKLETFIFTDQPADDPTLEGTWLVRFKGQGTLSISGRAQRVALEADGTGRFDYTPGDGLVSIAITDTDPNDPLRDIAIFKEAHAPLFEVGALFNPAWLDKIEDLRGIRFMDWMNTNGSKVALWEDRPKVTDFSWVEKGVPLPVMLELANTIGADPWFNIPHLADDTYVRNFAQEVYQGLDPRLMAYVEYSNEVWNFIFPQAVYARDRSEEIWGKDDTGWMQFYGLRAAQVMDIWSDVYGSDDSRLVRVAATHTGWQGLEEFVLFGDKARRILGKDAVSSFDAYAVTGYFGFEIGGEEFAPRLNGWLDASEARATEDAEAQGLKQVRLREYVARNRFDGVNEQVAQALKEGSVKELVEVIFPYHARVTSDAGLDLVMYEGGTHVAGHGVNVSDERMTEFFKQFNYTPELAGIYDTVLTGWRDAGGQLFNAFVDVAPASQWGSWGSLRHLTDSNPRWDALAAFNAAGDGGWQSRAASDFANGARLTGDDGDNTLTGSLEEDLILGGPGDDTLVPKGGLDRIHGGPGDDIVDLPGTIGDYQFARSEFGLVARSDLGTVHMADVETIGFSDGILIPAAALSN